ncbi:hypothetical protein HUK80_06200 [Flavobacterium sp. MAH-1]|uniref:SMODS and SLOG-associating 2TM effector domain-containing protein n=1 Tax=Flavobacterium agri TaxID=2743471 RepID=A0A7Y8Y138_9FLAO|nr:hypothetical protein [Flavobacterium agri]NUY80481.1 hypothetical protein [Flavobacterium agri]NYA70506.1 hypothetical protein [Flavobacterium agri]
MAQDKANNKSAKDILDAMAKAAQDAPETPLSGRERAFYEKHLSDLENEKQNREERKHYAECIFRLTVFWVAFLMVVIIASGQHKLYLSDEVLIALITSGTVNMFVFFRYVTRYLFNADKST